MRRKNARLSRNVRHIEKLMKLNNSIAYFKQVMPGVGSVDIEVPDNDLPFCVDYAKDISIFFLNDADDHYEIVQNKHLHESGISEKELLECGINNLRDVLQNIEISKNEGVLYFSGSGDFEASLLLIPELWEPGLSEHCPNGFIAAIPARDILVVCDKNDEDGTKKLQSIIEKIWPDGDHLLSRSLFIRNSEKWQPVENA